MQTPKCVIYAQTGTSDDLDVGPWLARQFEICQEYAQAPEWDVVAIFAEGGVSGNAPERHMLRNALTYLEQHSGIQHFVVSDLDRLARNLELLLQLQSGITARGAELVCVRGPAPRVEPNRLQSLLCLAHGSLYRRKRYARFIDARPHAR